MESIGPAGPAGCVMLAATPRIAMESWFTQARRVVAPLREWGSAESTLDTVVASPPARAAIDPEIDGSLEFTMKLASALLGYGLPVHRLEEALLRLSDALGFEAAYYMTPTGLIFTFGSGGEQRTRVVNAVPGDVDLERLAALHELIGRVERREIAPEEGSARIDAILTRPPRYRGPVRVLSFGLLSLAAAQLLGGNATDLAAAAAIALLVGLLSSLSSRLPTLGRLLPAVAATLVSVLSITASRLGLPVHPSILLLASIMSLLPGLTMTIAMMELAMANLVSGTARLMGAVVTFLQLGFGIALGHRLAHSLFVVPRVEANDGLPAWTQALAPLGAALAFGVLLRVRPRDLSWVLVTCSLAVLGSRGGGTIVGPEVGAFLGAFLVGVVSHLFARWKDRPVLVLLVPGVLMMVPGSIGFLGLSALLAEDPAAAVQTAFEVLMIATALSTGVLLATLAVPPRRSL